MQWWNGNVLVTLYYFSEKQLRYNIISTLPIFVVVVLINQKNKQTNKLIIYLSFVKLYFSSTFNYVQFNHINLKFLPFLQHLTDDFQIGNSMRFFKNASKTQYSGRKKVILKGRAQKVCVHSPLKKVAEESNKDKLIDFRRTWN